MIGTITLDIVFAFAEFMHLMGSVKVKPTSWIDLFIPALHSRKDSGGNTSRSAPQRFRHEIC